MKAKGYLFYTSDDDGVHLACQQCHQGNLDIPIAPCWEKTLGYHPTVEDAMDAWQEHQREVHPEDDILQVGRLDMSALHSIGRAIVVGDVGDCAYALDRKAALRRLCKTHQSLIPSGMYVCDVFLSRMRLMEDLVRVLDPVIRKDQEQWLEQRAASVAFHESPPGAIGATYTDPYDLGWFPVSVEMIPRLVENSRAATRLAQAEALGLIDKEEEES